MDRNRGCCEPGLRDPRLRVLNTDTDEAETLITRVFMRLKFIVIVYGIVNLNYSHFRKKRKEKKNRKTEKLVAYQRRQRMKCKRVFSNSVRYHSVTIRTFKIIPKLNVKRSIKENRRIKHSTGISPSRNMITIRMKPQYMHLKCSVRAREGNCRRLSSIIN